MAESKDKRLERYRRLIEISRDLASTLDLDPLLTRIVEAARDITDAQAASILLYDQAGRQLYFQVATNMDPMMRGLAVPMDSIAGWIVTNRRAVRSGDVHQDTRYFKNVATTLSFETHSLLGIPLITKDKVIGVLETLNKTSGNFTESDEDMLMVLGAQAAVAIENTRLFQQSDLIAEFVHELRTPLSSLSTATYLLTRPEISREQADQIISNIHTETLRLNTLASSFLDLSRLESGRVQYQKSSFALQELIADCKSIVQNKAEENHIVFEINIPENIPAVVADRDKIKQVVLNLLSNAIKYNRPGGKVTVGAGWNKSEWFFSVTDTGLGIPEDSLPNLFTKFYRVRSSENYAIGTGLGLSICKQIVQGHSGRIEVKSKLGEGTTFTALIPNK
jgi:signal transduction histidine kinase